MKKILLVFVAAFALNFLNAQNVYSEYRDGELFIKVKQDEKVLLPKFASGSAIPQGTYLSELIEKYGITELTQAFDKLNDPILNKIYHVEFTKTDKVDDLMKDVSALPFMEYAERVPLYKVCLTPNDPRYSSDQWYMTSTYINAANGWDLHTGTGSVVVAVVDDACLTTHQDLSSKIWINPGEIAGNGIDDDGNGYIDDVNGWDAADNDNNPNPPSSASTTVFTHGTHCCGIAGAATNNAVGVASVGFNIRIMPVKCTENINTGPYLDDTYGGMQYAVAARANVISMSFGGTGYSSTVQSLINYGNSLGITWVAAAGNDNVSTLFYPAAYTNVISVSATGTGDVKASFSNYGSWIDIAAPGVNIYSTLAASTTSYGYLSGTSMACPMVAGLCGLIKSYNSSFTPAQIETCLKNGSDNINAANPSYIGQLGTGRIDVFGALNCASPSAPPVADFTANRTSICPGGTVTFTDASTYGPTSRNWTFAGGTPATSTATNPTVTYASPGTYAVTLRVSNSFGADTLTRTGYITVNAAGLSLPFVETFESGSFATNNWTIVNPDASTTWAISTISGTTPGTKAAKMDFYNYSATGQRDALVTPSLNLSGATSAKITFEYAYRRYNTSSSDSLIVYVSTDCGATFPYRVLAKGENGTGVFATQTTSTSAFTPASTNDWCFATTTAAICDTINLSAFLGYSNVAIKFEGYNNYGNNLFLDNINITSTTTPLAPVADFIGSPTTVVAGNAVNFTDLSTNTPTSWAWSFPGAATTSSTLQNPTGIVYNTPGTYNVTLTATNTVGSDIESKTNYITVVAPASGSCDTVTNYIGPAALYTATAGGYLAGHNAFGDLAKADYYANATGATSVDGVLMYFGEAYASSPSTSRITVRVWDNDGTGGAPNTVLASQDVLISNIRTAVLAGNPIAVNFASPVAVSGPYYVGFEMYYGTGGAIVDTVGAITDTIRSSGNTAWEKFSDGTWYPFSSTSSWGIHLHHAFFPYSCSNPIPVADFTSDLRTIYAGQNVDYYDLSTNVPTSWSWSFAGGTPTSSSVQHPANIVYNTPGTYNSQLIASNSYGADTVLKSNYITVWDVPTTGCDTVWNIGSSDNLALYTFTSPSSGYIGGHNSFGDLAKAEKFTTYPPGAELSGALFYFGAARSSGATAKIVAKVWDASGFGGAPGTVLASEDVYLNSIVADVTAGRLTYVPFTTPVVLSGPIYIGFEMTYALNDSVGLVTNSIGESVPATAWEKQSTGNWFALDDTNSLNAGLSFAILAQYCPYGLTAYFEADDTSVCEGSTVNFSDLSSTGATSWSWSFPGGSPTSSTSRNPAVYYPTAGVYNVSLTVSDGSSSDSYTRTSYIHVNARPTISFNTTHISCHNANDGRVTANAIGGTAPYVFSWSTGASSSTISSLAAGTYSLTLTDANGCSDMGSVVIINPAVITASTTVSNVRCNGETNGSITVNANGGTLPYSFNRGVGVQDSARFVSLATGTYTITITDANGCTATTSATVNEPLVLTAATSTTDASCGSSDGSAVATSSGGTAPYSYDWSTGASGSTISGLAAGSYTLTVTDNNGCSATAAASISNAGAPTVSISSQNVNCAGAADGMAWVMVSGGALPYSYSWSNGETDSLAGPLAPGTYTVTITDATACIAVRSVTITTPTAMSLSTNVTNEGCNQSNGTASVTVSGGTPTYSYNWSNGATTASISGLDAGTYLVTVTDSKGCTATRSVVIISTSAPLSSMGPVNPSCPGANNGSINLSVSGGVTPYTFAWSSGQTTEDLSGIAAGSYSVTITDANGCTTSNSVSLVNTSSFSTSVTVNMASSSTSSDGTASVTPIGGTAPYSYSWNTGASTSTVSGLSVGDYTVTTTDVNGCSKVDTIHIGITGISVFALNTEILVYPNPADDEINVSLSFDQNYQVQMNVFNVLGEQVIVKNVEVRSGIEKLNVSHLSAGVYYLQLKVDDQSTTIKFIKETD